MHGDIQAVFDTEPPQRVLDEIVEAEELAGSERRPTLEELFPITVFGAGEVGDGVGRRKTGLDSHDSAMERADEQEGPEPGSSHQLSGGEAEVAQQKQKQQPESTTLQAKPSQGPGAHRHTKPARKDSIVDYGAESDGALTEANDRLQKLEESVQRIEEMMIKVFREASIAGKDDGGGGPDFAEDN